MLIAILLTACQTNSDKKDCEHDYVRYWNRYTTEQLVDNLYADTLIIGPDIEGEYTNHRFYIDKTSELLQDLRDDLNKTDSLYPQTAFDELTIKKLPFGNKQTFTNEQLNRFLAVINDPTSFDWSETTYEPGYRLNFLSQSQVVASLTIGADFGVIKTESSWPAFKKMKFGSLKQNKRTELLELIGEFGL